MAKVQLLTIEGKKSVEDELRYLIDVKRPEVIKLIQDAREQGDLSENADYDAAKAMQSQIESRIKELQTLLNSAKIIEEKTSLKQNVVTVGVEVELLDHSDRKHYKYEIVGTYETDPSRNKISNESPLAKAMIGHKEGDQVEVIGIEEPYSVTIKKIKKIKK